MSIKYFISKLIKKLMLPAIKNSTIDKTAKICSGAHLVNVFIGRYSYIGNYCTVINVKIGAFSSIADNCIIGGSGHPLNWVSTSPVFYSGKNILKKNFFLHEFKKTNETTIGNDVWIGSNCLIKGGVVIGNGSVVGMGAVVIQNVGSYEIWAGNPAKLIRKRFSEETIEKLVETHWWDFSDKVLFKLAPYFENPETLLERLKK